MQPDKDKFLLPEADGLPVYEVEPHTAYKLKALETYLHITDTAMAGKNWRARYFIDLQAGSGKNNVAGEIRFGSPLIALTSPRPADEFRFNELGKERHDALVQRVSASPLANRVKVFQNDLNKVVDDICNELAERDKARLPDKWSTFNIAFLDPEGLELQWNTVEKLAKIRKMDLIINFSTSGIIRTIGKGYLDAVDRFFGTDTWRAIDNVNNSASERRRRFIEFYLERLKKFGYHVDIDPEFHFDNVIQVRNRKESEIYSIIFASKNQLGSKFWQTSAKTTKPPRLPGF